MPSIINALTASGGGVAITGDATGNLALQTAGNTAVTIDTSQNVMVGTTTALNSAANRGNITIGGSASSILNLGTGATTQSYLYHIQSGNELYLVNAANGPAIFYTNNTERMRITSGGYLKVSNNGTYTNVNDSFHEVNQSANNHAWYIRANNASQTLDACQISTARNTTNNSYYALAYYNGGAGAYKFLVADSGNCTNTNGSYGTISDIKNKENIVDATPKLDKISQLKVRNYNFIGDNLKQIGFVAQEFEQIFPSMVEEHPDKDENGNDLGTTTKSIKTSVLVPILVKAIQELKAELDATKAEVAALKGVA